MTDIAPTITGQSLTIGIPVGTKFTVSGVLNYSDGTSKPVTAYAFHDFDRTIVNNDGTEGHHAFTALAAGTTTLKSDNSRTTGTLTVNVLPAGNALPVTPPSFIAIADAIQAAILKAAVYDGVPLMDSLQITQDAEGNAMATVTTSAQVMALINSSLDTPPGSGNSQPPPNYPPTPPSVTGTVTVTATLADGTPLSATVQPGQRVAFDADDSHGSVMYYADGAVCLENGYLGTTGDLTGNFIIRFGDTQLFSGPLTIWAHARTHPWWIVAPTINGSADLSLFPKIGTGSESASVYDAYIAADNSPMGSSLWHTKMADTGEEFNLGPVPQGDSCYLANPSTNNGTVVLGLADAANVFPFCFIDRNTNKMVSVLDYPRISWDVAHRGATGNPIVPYTTETPLSLAQAQGHAPVLYALAAALTGADCYKEGLSLWANFVQSLWANPDYRISAGCCGSQHCEVRGKGRGLVATLYATRYSDNTAYFDAWVKAIATDYNAHFAAQTGIQVDQQQSGYPNNGFPPWQNHLLCYAAGLGVDFGYDFQFTHDYLGKTILDSILVTQHELATVYNASWKDASGNIAPDWATALQFAGVNIPKIAAALACAEGSQALQDAYGEAGNVAGDFVGYPASPTGYPALLQATLAKLVDRATDQTRAAAAWTKYTQYSTDLHPTRFADNPKYNAVPRA